LDVVDLARVEHAPFGLFVVSRRSAFYYGSGHQYSGDRRDHFAHTAKQSNLPVPSGEGAGHDGKGIIIMADNGNGTGSNAVWAIAFVIIVAIIGAVVYYSGILKTKPGKTEVDIKVTAPAAPAASPAPSR
jgi:hypothetical protein